MKTGLSFQTVLGPFSCFDSYAQIVKSYCACFFQLRQMAHSSNTEVGDVPPIEEPTKAPTFNCFQCNEICDQLEMYRCSCDGLTLEGNEVYYCDCCIVSHIRKQHEVVNSKGYKPAVCSTHRVLCTSFCEKCLVLLCSKCLFNHRKHKVKGISDKASEVKKLVFGLLDEFDQLAKPLSKRKNIVDSSYKSMSELYPNLDDSFIDGLCINFERVVRTKESMWLEMASKSKSECDFRNLADEVDLNISKLRSMLAMSDGLCLSTFFESEKEMESCVKAQKSALKEHSVFGWRVGLDHLIEASVKTVLESWLLPVINHLTIHQLQCSSQTCSIAPLPENVVKHSLFDLSISGDCISFLAFESSGEDSVVKSYQLGVSGVLSIFKCENQLAVVCDTSRCVNIYNLGSRCIDRTFSLTERQEIILFFSIQKISFRQKYCFIFWDSGKSCIYSCSSLLPNGWRCNWEVSCEKKPVLLNASQDILIFVEANGKLVIFSLNLKLKLEVLPQHHGLTKIDNICFGSSATVILFDYQEKLILISSYSLTNIFNINWAIENLYKVDFIGEPSYMIADSNTIYVFDSKNVRCYGYSGTN